MDLVDQAILASLGMKPATSKMHPLVDTSELEVDGVIQAIRFCDAVVARLHKEPIHPYLITSYVTCPYPRVIWLVIESPYGETITLTELSPDDREQVQQIITMFNTGYFDKSHQ